ncbi:MAG: hypothetical protein NTY08_11090 [Proteobacteria bacterium]|nr:hypothetical protein [Pseudomonadota bacterium]
MTLADFIAVEGDLLPSLSPTVLTPRVMHWHEQTWLLDLSSCHSYWQSQAIRQQTAVHTLVEDILRRSLGTNMRAVMADHPWQALLALAQMRARTLNGMLDLRHKFGRAFYQQVDWDAWFSCAEELSTHATTLAWPRFHAAVFRRHLRQMQAVISQIQPANPPPQHAPWHWRGTEPPSMRRRFGTTVALLWEWSFPRPGTDRQEPQTHPLGFPWLPWSEPEKPHVSRHLETPLAHWDELAPLLVEDLDRLCTLPTWDERERVTALSWRLTLDDLSEATVPLLFRHPHSLARERGHHQTAVFQANYSFSAHKKAAASEQDQRGIVGWELVIDERLVLPPFVKDLFGEQSDSDTRHLLMLENQLSIPLDRYELREDWVPETAFVTRSTHADEKPSAPDREPHSTGSSGSTGSTGSNGASESDESSWLPVARSRPFYIDIPRPLDTEGHSTARIFLERVTGKWWLNTAGASQRDYYAVIDREHRWIWAYRDQGGTWWSHGRFD